MKSVSCEYDRWVVGWNSTVQAAWYIRHAHRARLLCYMPFVVLCLWIKSTMRLVADTQLTRRKGRWWWWPVVVCCWCSMELRIMTTVVAVVVKWMVLMLGWWCRPSRSKGRRGPPTCSFAKTAKTGTTKKKCAYSPFRAGADRGAPQVILEYVP